MKRHRSFSCRGAHRLQMVLLAVLVATGLLGLVGCENTFTPPPEVTITDTFVDLRPQQSSLKNQGQRTTCIVFAAMAAVEAAYIRLGYGELDLSEEFINFTRKAFYLDPRWDVVLARGADARETQLGSAGGGGGVGVLGKLNKGFMVPRETAMRYQPNPLYYEERYPQLVDILERRDAGEELTQRDLSDFNLDPTILSTSVLRTETFYSVQSYRELDDARSPQGIENVLRRGYEVVWDFAGANPSGGSSGAVDAKGVWQVCASCPQMAHSMLIVGFDRRHRDPRRHYFIVKNSWGSAAAQEDGYTLISYDYVRQYGTAAAYVRLPAAPRPWPELAFIGRWDMNYDGHQGVLDIYHLPGMAEQTLQYNLRQGVIPEMYDDHRLGSFYDSEGNAYKVNGYVVENRIEFYIDWDRPNVRWDSLTGDRFVYYLHDYGDSLFMAGHYRDSDDNRWGSYARKSGLYWGGAATPRPFSGSSYIGSGWHLFSGEYGGEFEFTAYAPESSNSYDLLDGTFSPWGSSSKYPAQIMIPFDEPHRVNVQIADIGDGSSRSFVGRHLRIEPGGLIVGDWPFEGTRTPFRMARYPDG